MTALMGDPGMGIGLAQLSDQPGNIERLDWFGLAYRGRQVEY